MVAWDEERIGPASEQWRQDRSSSSWSLPVRCPVH